MEKQMIEDITELKVNQALLIQKQESTDKVISDMEVTLGKISKGGYIFLGIYIANSIGAGDALKLLGKLLIGG